MKEYYEKYLISEVAGVLNISPGLIRHYEKIGLIEPLLEPSSNYRRFNLHLVQQLCNIVMFRSLNLPLEEIGSVHSPEIDDLNPVLQILDSHKEDLERQIAALQSALLKTCSFRDEFQRAESTLGRIEIVTSPQLNFFSLYNNLNAKDLAQGFLQYSGKSSHLPKSAFLISEKDFASEELSIEAYSRFGVCVEGDLDAGIYFRQIAKRESVYTSAFVSTMEELNSVYQELKIWMESRNLSISDEVIELCTLSVSRGKFLEIYVPFRSKV